MFSGIIIGEFTLLCIYLQDTSGSRAKDHPVVSSPVPITTAPAAAAHGKLLVLLIRQFFLPAVSVKLQCFSCSTSSSSCCSNLRLTSCYEHCYRTAWTANQQPCVPGVASPLFVLT